ncbi:hypothetical protein ASE51_24755 [Bacillus sp. Root147]|nr:hypothetical protein ASE51_24755 [Bacillus sp. Root147]
MRIYNVEDNPNIKSLISRYYKWKIRLLLLRKSARLRKIVIKEKYIYTFNLVNYFAHLNFFLILQQSNTLLFLYIIFYT